MTQTLRARAAKRLFALSLLGLLAACDLDSSGVPPHETPATRPSDGLLSDPVLQAVVDAQVARDSVTLVGWLGAERADVRARAALALGSVQASGALEPLGDLLTTDPEEAVRRDAALAIGQIGSSAAVVILTAGMASEDAPRVRDRILEALGRVGRPEAGLALRTVSIRAGEEARRSLALAVNGAVGGAVTQEGHNFLLSRLDDPDPATRAAAAYYFSRLRDASVWAGGLERVRGALDGYDSGDVAATDLIKALGTAGHPEDVDRLSAWARTSTDWRSRAEAMVALRPHALDPSAAEVLLQGLDDPSMHVAANAAAALATGGQPPSVIGRIEAWIDSGQGSPAATEPLMLMLSQQNEREYVFQWIDALPQDDVVGWTLGLAAVAALSGTDALTRLEGAARSPSEEVSASAVVALGQRWADDRRDASLHERYYRLFAAALTSGNPRAEFSAGQSLTDPLFRPMGSSRLFMDAYALHETEADPRPAAELLRLLSMAEDAESEGLLRQALNHPAVLVRRTAASGLERLTEESVDYTPGPEWTPTSREAGALAYDPTVIDWSYLASVGAHPTLTFVTTRGDIVLRLATEEAPQTVQTMTRLASEGRLDGTPFHRVVPDFVAQGGDVSGENGRGGPGFQIRSELNGLAYVRGAIGMASAGKDTEGSQFFLAHRRLPHLDGGYTVFGWVVEGMDVVDRIVRDDMIIEASFSPGR